MTKASEGTDVVILDLEDSVSESQKVSAVWSQSSLKLIKRG